jgi:hypothetical protein
MKTQPLKITDLNGCGLEIDNLQLSIMQADDYRHYRVSKPTQHDLYLYEYWEDVYQKLLLLGKEIKNDN